MANGKSNEVVANAWVAPLSGDVNQWIRTWGEAVSQIGLFNVNIVGSTNPRMEKRITGKWGYGRQLGRILDVLEPLVDENKETLLRKHSSAVKDFEDMVKDIRDIEHSSVEDIVAQVRKLDKNDLARLRVELGKLPD